MPAPPPESLPAIESARGRDGRADGGERRAVGLAELGAGGLERLRAWQRDEQLVVLPAAEGVLEAGAVGDRHVGEAQARAGSARAHEAPEVHREPIGDVHHRRGAVARQDRALAHARDRSHVRVQQRAIEIASHTPAARDMQAGRRGAERARDGDQVPGRRTGARHGASGRDLARHRDGDRDRVGGRQVAADEPQRVFVAGLTHAPVQLDHPCGAEVGAQRERHEGGARAGAHRRDIAHAHHDRLVPEVPRRRDAEVAAPGREDGRVVARTDDHLRPGARQDARDRGRQLVLAQLHPRSVPVNRPPDPCADGPNWAAWGFR
jgi:hypothetical protein